MLWTILVALLVVFGLATSYGECSVMPILLSMAVAVVLIGLILTAETADSLSVSKAHRGCR